jgi:hypothetical protein
MDVRQRERDAAQLPVEAVQRELDAALERRRRHVEKNRPKMLKDARREVEAARDTLLARINTLPALRDKLVAARETVARVSTFPEPTPAYGFPNNVALGLREPLERTLGTEALLMYEQVVAALVEDAHALADRHDRAVLEQLGTAPPRTPLTEAMWDSDPDNEAWKKRELERARQLAHGGNVNQLAAEVRHPRESGAA